MALPKTVTINGLAWTIQIDSTCIDGLGSYDSQTRIIKIDGDVDEDRQMEILQHELLEACMSEQGIIYVPYPWGEGDKDRLFVMSHRQFSAINKVFYDVISQIYGKKKG